MSAVAPPTPSLPPPIRSYVAGYVSLRRWRDLSRAAGVAVAFTIAWVVGCCLIDWRLKLSADTRLVLLAIGVLVPLALVARPIARLFGRRIDWLKEAAEIERREPAFGERLQTIASQRLEPVSRYRASDEIVDQLTREVGQRLVTVRPHRLVPSGPALRAWLAAGAAALVASALVRLPNLDMPTLLHRYVMPTAKVAPVTTTRLDVTPGDAAVVEGHSLIVNVTARRLGEHPPVLHVSRGDDRPWTTTPMKPVGDAVTAGAFTATVPKVDRDARYYLTGGDATSPVYNVRVLRRPVARGFRLHHEYPPAARRPAETLVRPDGAIEAPARTTVTVQVVASEPLASARLTLSSGPTFAMEPTDDPAVFRTRFTVLTDGAYTVEMTSRDGVTSASPAARFAIRALPDRPPTVRLLGFTGELRLGPRATFSLPYHASDDYVVASLRMRLEIDPSQAMDAGALANIARGMPTTQSSTTLGADASRAADGNSDGHFGHGSVTHTDRAAGNWWLVDLGGVRPISVVEVWNRTDAAVDRLRDFDVVVSERPIPLARPAATVPVTTTTTTATSPAPLFTSDLLAGPWSSVFRVPGAAGRPTTVDVYRSGRYVQVVLPHEDYLSLAEVRVYEARPPAVTYESPESGVTTVGGVDEEVGLIPTVVERDVPLRAGSPAEQAGEVPLDLAGLNLRLGDVVTVSLRAADSAGQSVTSEACRIVISPRSVDVDTYRRISELEAAAASLDAAAAAVDASVASFDGARQAAEAAAHLPALSQMHRHLTSAVESSDEARASLLRAIARGGPSALLTAAGHYADAVEATARLAERLNVQFTVDRAPGEPAKASLAQAAGRVKQVRQELAVVIEGQKAAALLAEIENFTASQRVPPQATRHAARRVRERLDRMEQDIAAAARELSLDPNGPDDLRGQLNAKIAAADALVRAKDLPDLVPVAAEFAQAMTSGAPPPPGLAARLNTAAQAEALRPDADAVRAHDLQLAAVVASVLSRSSTQPVVRGPTTAPSPSTATAPLVLAVAELPPLLAALQREHGHNRQPLPPAEAEPVRTAATNARAQLAAIAESLTTAPAPAGARPDATLEQLRLEELVLRVNAQAGSRNYAAAEETDRLVYGAISERAAADVVATDVARATAAARRLELLADAQGTVRDETQRASPHTDDRERHARELADRQRALAESIARAAAADGASAGDADSSRLRAERAMRSARQRLARLPEAVAAVASAVDERRSAREAAEVARQRADAAGLEDWALANRAAVAAELQLEQADARLQQLSAAADPDVAEALADALRPFAPETAEAVRLLDERLVPALSGLRQSGSTADAAAVERAVTDATSAAEQARQAVVAAHDAVLAADPLLAARAAAEAAGAVLARPAYAPADAAERQREAATLQDQAMSALWHAARKAARQAAVARLSTLATIAPLLSPVPLGMSPREPDAVARTPETTQPLATQQAPVTTAAPRSLFQALRDWGRLPWRLPTDVAAGPQESDPAAYREAIGAYFEAIRKAHDGAPATQAAGAMK